MRTDKSKAPRTLILGTFTVVENYFGTIWGLVVGMVFGVGEILAES